MNRSESRATRGSVPGDVLGRGEPALRDAAEIVARAAADEDAADRARERYRAGQMLPLAPDARAAAFLEPGEVLVAIRQSAQLERRQPQAGSGTPSGLGGTLYVTSQRLVLLGRVRLTIGLDEIQEAFLSGERLLLVLRDGQGIALEASLLRLLRVEIAAARAANR